MTDAQVQANNTSDCDDRISESTVQFKNATKHNNTHPVLSNQESNCNISLLNANSYLVVLELPVNNTIEQKINDTQNKTHVCEPNAVDSNCNENSYKIPYRDTVMKYVYKKDEIAHIKEKTKAHPLNSLRKKRSALNEEVVTVGSKNAPLIVNYETQHTPRDIELVTPAHEHIHGNKIRNSALADFNIETLHDHHPPASNRKESDKSFDSGDESQEINSQENFKDEEKSKRIESSEIKNLRTSDDRKQYESSRETDESEENNKSRENDSINESNESKEKDNYIKNKSTSLEEDLSQENKNDEESYHPKNKKLKYKTGPKTKNNNIAETYSESSNSEENEKSTESQSHSEEDNRSFPITRDESEEVTEKDEYKQQDKPFRNISHQSTENSDETNEPRDQSAYNNEKEEYNNEKSKESMSSKTSNSDVQDVDLGDFSYERIKVDDRGQVVSAQEYNEDDTSISVQSTLRPEIRFNEFNDAAPYTTTSPSSHYEFTQQEPVHFNDGEIKPVVEINSDNRNTKTSEENTNEELKAKTENDQSLETLLGTKVNEDKPNDKIASDEEQEDKRDIKQQFERIPLNYKHDSIEQDQTKQDRESDNTEEKSQVKDVDHDDNEGTLDNLSPNHHVNYDEHLNYKFDDLTIKLPEIKLPDDILSYAYETPSYEKKKEQKPKDKFYHYSDEIVESKELEEQKRRPNYDDKDDSQEYRGYYKNQHKKQNPRKTGDDDDDDDDVDLYEKFVRERFGKRSSFGKRAAKLQDALPNEKLYKTVQNILKKTQEIDNQAKKSGDPNAGYMWTLEYGEKL